jgi:DNA adenine methylase
MKTPLSYYGGKQRIASQIVPYIHRIPHTVYAEPFCGGLSILYAKGKYIRGNSDYYREAINDANKCLITFWRVARKQPEELARWIELTPYSQEEYRESLKIYRSSHDYPDSKVAWATFIQCNMSFANKIGGGWKTQNISQNSAATWNNKKQQLPECFERLNDVHIGCEDALDFIGRWDSPQTLFYLDPPYPETHQGHYKGYTLEDFQALCNALDNCEASYILSNYPQETAPKSVQQYVEIEAVMSASKDIINVDTKRTECLWICDRSSTMRPDLMKITKIENKAKNLQCSLF